MLHCSKGSIVTIQVIEIECQAYVQFPAMEWLRTLMKIRL